MKLIERRLLPKYKEKRKLYLNGELKDSNWLYDPNESIRDEKVIKKLENVGTSFSFFDKPVFLHSSCELLIELIREDNYHEYYHKYEVEKRDICGNNPIQK